MADYPQLVRSWENIDVIAHRLIAKNLVPSYDNLVFVLHELAKDGAVSLSPSAIRAGEEDQISGETLKRHANLKQLLRPAEEIERQRVANQSAEEYRKEHASDWPAPSIPPLVMAGIEKNLDAFASLHPDYVRCPENAAKMISAVQNRGPISIQLLEEAYNGLRGQLQTNNAVKEYGATRLVDLGGRPRTPVIQHQHVELENKKIYAATNRKNDIARIRGVVQDPEFVRQVDEMER